LDTFEIEGEIEVLTTMTFSASAASFNNHKEIMKYQIIEKSWSKRRKIDQPKVVDNIKFIDFKKKHNHFCKMLVCYSDKSEVTLISRVIFNEIKKHWTVDGMHVAVRLLE